MIVAVSRKAAPSPAVVCSQNEGNLKHLTFPALVWNMNGNIFSPCDPNSSSYRKSIASRRLKLSCYGWRISRLAFHFYCHEACNLKNFIVSWCLDSACFRSDKCRGELERIYCTNEHCKLFMTLSRLMVLGKVLAVKFIKYDKTRILGRGFPRFGCIRKALKVSEAK